MVIGGCPQNRRSITTSTAPTWKGLLTATEWGTKPFRLWELILADNAEAEFIVAGVGKPREGVASYYLMQFIHHDVMTSYKSSINSGRLQYR